MPRRADRTLAAAIDFHSSFEYNYSINLSTIKTPEVTGCS